MGVGGKSNYSPLRFYIRFSISYFSLLLTVILNATITLCSIVVSFLTWIEENVVSFVHV